MPQESVYIPSSFMKTKRLRSAAGVSRGSEIRRPVRHLRRLTVLALVGTFAIALSGCGSEKFPVRSSKTYDEVVSAFYVGLAALQVGDDVHADAKLAQVTQLVAGEPAGWGNWGVLALRQRDLDAAAQRFERARSLAPQNDHVYDLIGGLESARGRSV